VTELLTTKQAAERLGCSEAAIRKWLAQRRVRAVRLGRLVRLRSADVERIATEGLPDRPN
jgi:excisionase family DNA binding protein